MVLTDRNDIYGSIAALDQPLVVQLTLVGLLRSFEIASEIGCMFD